MRGGAFIAFVVAAYAACALAAFAVDPDGPAPDREFGFAHEPTAVDCMFAEMAAAGGEEYPAFWRRFDADTDERRRAFWDDCSEHDAALAWWRERHGLEGEEYPAFWRRDEEEN